LRSRVGDDVWGLENDTGVSEDLLEADPRFKRWLHNFIANGNQPQKIRFAGVIQEQDRVYSILIEVHFLNRGIKFVRSILIRGPAVVIVPIVFSDNLRDSKFLTVRQVRISTGALTDEFPSGGCLGVSKVQCALAELKEETGITIEPDRLQVLREDIVVCESAFDETVTWYAVKLNPEEIKLGQFGVKDRGELTSTSLVDWKYLTALNSFHMHTARKLLEEHYDM